MAQKGMAFSQKITIHFDEADPAGVCFFGTTFSKIHRVYEAFISSLGIPLEHWFLQPDRAVPIRQAEANFLKPLHALQSYDVQVNPISISDSSFRLLFVIGKNGQNHCNIITTHTCFDAIKKTKRFLPDEIREKLKSHLIQVAPE